MFLAIPGEMALVMATITAAEMAYRMFFISVLYAIRTPLHRFMSAEMTETTTKNHAQKRQFIGLKTGNGSHSRDVSRRNTDAVLLWTYQWGWTTENALKELLQLKRRLGYEMSRRGYLEKVSSPKASRLPFAYVISSAALRSATNLYAGAFNASNPLPYPWPRKPVPLISLGEHQEKAIIS